MKNSQSDKSSKVFDFQSVLKYHIIPVAVAGMIDRSLLHPVDTITTLKQSKDAYLRDAKFSELISYVKNNKGFKGFYAGFFWSFISAIPIRISIYSTYSLFRDGLPEKSKFSKSEAMLMGGMASGFLETTILCPSEANRTRKALGISVSNPLRPSIFYRGYLPLLARTCTENTVALAGSDLLLEQLQLPDRYLNVAPYFTGFFSGMVSQVAIAPIDMLKTRVMSDYSKKSIYAHSKELVAEGRLFSSAYLKVLRMGVGNALMVGTISLTRRAIENHDNTQAASKPKMSI